MTTQPWQNRIVGHADVDPLTLKAHPKNFRTHALIKVGEYDQEIALSVFTPWFNALAVETTGDRYCLMQLIKVKLGIVA